MKSFTNILIGLLSILLLCNSFNGEVVDRQKYQPYTLDRASVQSIPLKNKGWKQISSVEHLEQKTVLMVSSDYIVDSLVFPPNVEVHFCGGSIKGNINFNDTFLSGSVRLHGSNISGTVQNDVFQTGWICYGDGINDDAKYINQILNVCNNVRFNKGTYLLLSYHTPMSELNSSYHSSVKSHIGIYKNSVTLIGDEGASLLIKEPSTAICVYCLPNDIEHSVENIRIQGLTIRNENNGNEFYEFFHTIKLIGVKDFLVSDCHFFDFWGDAIALSHYGDTPDTGERTRNSHVIITGNYIDGGRHNNRNGVSVISGANVIVENNIFIETSRYNMPGSIDIEANNSAYTVENIVVKDNIIQGCQGGLGSIGIVSNNQEAPAKQILIKGNVISDTERGVCCLINSQSSTENIRILDNEFLDCKQPLILRGDGRSKNWKIKRNSSIDRVEFSGELMIKNLRTDAKLIER